MSINNAWLISAIAVACAWAGTTARADATTGTEKPSVLVISAKADAGSPEAAVLEAVRDALAQLDEVRLLPPSPLDLESVQLALDCTDESAHCLSEIATRMQARILVVPSLKKRRDALELHVTCFRRGTDEPLTVALRKQAGTQLDATLLDAVPGMLREALQLEDLEDAPAPEASLVDRTASDTNTRDLRQSPSSEHTSGGVPLGPVLLGSGGLALVVAGAVVGAMAGATEDEHASRTVETEAQAKRADALRERGEREALVANVMLGAGASALIAAGIWYVLDGSTEEDGARASVRPLITPGSAGVLLTGNWSSLP